MTREVALLLALGALAAAAALVSFGSWLLLRRGRGARLTRSQGSTKK
ncbi:MAG TPA: hypothetical protein VJP08_03165 [Actinomycetota bacterium]|nr:hypothetical protein [Actinomycetota bacterium]